VKVLNTWYIKRRDPCWRCGLVLLSWIVIGAPTDTFSQVVNTEVAGSPNAEDQSENPEVSNVSEEDRNWWAFQRPVRPPVPEFDDPRWSGNPVNAFIKRKMDEKGLLPARRADKHGLIRRAYLDLIGLLPDPEEVEAFVRDESSDAFDELINRLLESHHYGERWGRHWLDVARYADSGGYEQDFDYSNIWRYRDYVIRAFNEDKPYDRFVLEQLAGDELDEVTFDSLIATGFNRVGPRVGFREKDNPQYRYDYLDDMIGTTSQAFIGLTVQCARCHDHMFDPIPQMDYYRMSAIFFPHVNYDFPLAAPEEVAEFEARKAAIAAMIQPLQARIAEIERPFRKIAFAKKLERFPDYIRIAVRTPEGKRTPGQKLLAAQVLSTGSGSVRSLLSAEDRAKVAELRRQIKGLEEGLPKPLPVAMGMRDGDYRFAADGPGDEIQPGQGNREIYEFEGAFIPTPDKPYVPPKTHFLPTGDYHLRGSEVQPGLLQVLAAGTVFTPHTPTNGHITTGRRRALAEWIISDDHPLTARVMVNRIWQHHFGRGIVSTPNNFGRMGQPPSHPELLDWLAAEFVRLGWSIKAMHRLIMTSEAYRMASDHYVETNAEIDPTNRYLYRFPQRRLEAEAIRDILLSASGKLNLQMGGKPFFPPVPEEVRRAVFKGIWNVTADGPDVWRRSVYSYYKRGMRYPMFDVFDQPNTNITCESRDVTTVPTQALTLLNNDFVLKQAKHFAERVFREAGPEQAAQIRATYRIALSRDLSWQEMELNLGFLEQQRALHTRRGASEPQVAALTDLCHVVFNLNEFVYLN